MRILFLGDIVGRSGRDIVSSLLFNLKREYKIDLTIANGENAAHGKGISLKIYNQLMDLGIDYLTMGNHTFSKKEIINSLSLTKHMVIPRNHLLANKQNSYLIFEINKLKFCLTNILGDILIGVTNESPIEAMKAILKETENEKIDIYFVDYHGETTAEKRLFAEYFKDKVKICVGTHTHVQTADEYILNGDVAFISDVGMCGPSNSIIGRDIEETIKNKIYLEETHFKVAEGDAQLNAVVIEIDDNKKKPLSISRIFIRDRVGGTK